MPLPVIRLIELCKHRAEESVLRYAESYSPLEKIGILTNKQLWLDAAELVKDMQTEIAELKKQLEVQLFHYKWRAVSEAHEDFGFCVYINITAPGEYLIAHVLDQDYDTKIKGATHFARIPSLTNEEAEKLLAQVLLPNALVTE